MITERSNADIIRAYADGKYVQYRVRNVDFGWNTYGAQGVGSPCLGSPVYEWRIQPEVLQYRVALMKDGPNGKWISCQTKRHINQKALPDLEKNSDFVRWITDFIDVEVE